MLNNLKVCFTVSIFKTVDCRARSIDLNIFCDLYANTSCLKCIFNLIGWFNHTAIPNAECLKCRLLQILLQLLLCSMEMQLIHAQVGVSMCGSFMICPCMDNLGKTIFDPKYMSKVYRSDNKPKVKCCWFLHNAYHRG